MYNSTSSKLHYFITFHYSHSFVTSRTSQVRCSRSPRFLGFTYLQRKLIGMRIRACYKSDTQPTSAHCVIICNAVHINILSAHCAAIKKDNSKFICTIAHAWLFKLLRNTSAELCLRLKHLGIWKLVVHTFQITYLYCTLKNHKLSRLSILSSKGKKTTHYSTASGSSERFTCTNVIK